MSKNIVIQEGGTAKQMSVSKLRTDEVGGGSCLWVPEDGTKVMHKTITEEGVYKASELDSVYGYDEVTVDLSRKIKTKRIVENGVYYAEDDEILGYSEVDVNVPSDVHNTKKRITENGTYSADDEGFTGYSAVTVDVPAGRKRDKRITENGVYDPEEESLYGYGKLTVDIKKPQLKTKTIRDNGTYEAQKDDGVYGYSLVNVNVPLPKLKSRRITENGTYIANQEDREYEDAPSDVYGYSQVVVDVPQQGQVRTKTIRENGTYTAADEELLGYSVVNVNVPGGKLGTKSITENGTYTAADDNLYGFRSVSVRVAGSQGSADTQGRPTTANSVNPGGIGSSVVGRDTSGVISGISGGDNNEYAIGIDNSGNIVATKVPSGIEIKKTPNKTNYTAGETIDYSGIIVNLKGGDNAIFSNTDYPDGQIPFGELVFPTSIAPSEPSFITYTTPADDTSAFYRATGQTFSFVEVSVGTAFIYNISNRTMTINSANAKIFACNCHESLDSQGRGYGHIVLASSEPFTMLYREGSTSEIINVDYFHRRYGIQTVLHANDGIVPYQNVLSDDFAMGEDMLRFGTGQVSGGVDIPVQWVSPYDGRTFESKFNITVTASENSSGGSGTGTGSNTGGSGGNDDDSSGSGGSF